MGLETIIIMFKLRSLKHPENLVSMAETQEF